ncbi:transcription factor bHLH162 isoform X5 [Populus trichocarpa]|uniref:transcription factor bHLH162 isoform X5 n=1 Tax=Populus trichocarpa TaxID=3694 RepID=UPI0022788220|nr:transcription factor bHLH162 isoform X5 [Populus trichocarpa]
MLLQTDYCVWIRKIWDLQEAQPLPDQIDRAINYIKSLEEKLEKAREKKESLTRSRKGSYTCTFDPLSSAASKSPQLKIHEIGSALEIVLTSGLGNQFLFYEIISILHEEGVEVVSANFQALGDSFFHIVHAQMKGSADGFGAARVTERLNRFISGSTSEIELDSELWDFAVHHPKTNWEF